MSTHYYTLCTVTDQENNVETFWVNRHLEVEDMDYAVTEYIRRRESAIAGEELTADDVRDFSQMDIAEFAVTTVYPKGATRIR